MRSSNTHSRFASRLVLLLTVAVSPIGCGGLFAQQSNRSGQGPAVPTYRPGGNQTKVSVRKDRLRPLIVEWAASDRASLEATLRAHPVVVRYSGDELSVLPRCKAPGAYRYEPTTPKQDHVRIDNFDELKAQLPLGAASLEGKLRQSGRLDVNMNIVGQYDLKHDDLFRAGELSGDCVGATHVITSLTVGAFEFTAGGSVEAGGGVGIAGAGVEGKTGASKEVLNKDGDVKACESASRGNTEPPEGCGAIVRIGMAPLRKDGALMGSGMGGLGIKGISICQPGERLVQGTCVRQSGQDSGLWVSVTCGASNAMLSPEDDGLVVTVDGDEVKSERVQRARTYGSPGREQPVVFVAYPMAAGKHTVKVSARDCQAEEREIEVRVNSGPYRMFGKLRSEDLFQLPPAASMFAGAEVVRTMWLSNATVPAQSDTDFQADHDATFRDMSGWGGGLVFETNYLYFGWEFSVLKGKADVTLAQETQHAISRTGEDLSGTQQTFDTWMFQSPLLVGGRLPLRWLNLMAGTGFDWGIASYSGGNSMAVLKDRALPFLGLPVWGAAEVRPVCNVSFGARVAQEFTTPKRMPNSLSAAFFVSLGAAAGCSDEDFGIQ